MVKGQSVDENVSLSFAGVDILTLKSVKPIFVPDGISYIQKYKEAIVYLVKNSKSKLSKPKM